MTNPVTEAIREWTALLGPANVVTHADTLRLAGTATFLTRGRVEAVLKPGSREDVQACLQVANRFRVPVYPFSSGKNWGYGSRAPVGDGVLMDLGRMNRIRDFDEALAYVTIEPGVTQRQLHAFLTERGSRLWMDSTGASPDSSIIGNTMERGFGHTPMGDHCSHVCGFEVVLATGECITTGFARFGAQAGALGRWGVGPSLDGLFAQSNFGIVTSLTVWLMPAPEHFEAFFFSSQAEDAIGPIVEALRPLRLNGTLRSVIHIANDYKVLTATTRVPWEGEGRPPVLRGEVMDRLRRELGTGRWTGSGGLYGTRAQVREARAQVKRALAGKVNRLQFVDDARIGIIRRFAAPFGLVTGWDMRRMLSLLEPVYNLMKGKPTASTVATTYWRKKAPAPDDPDPDRDGCGLLWCSPVAPATAGHAVAVTRLASEVLLAHGFEPQISVSLETERSLICVTTISFDRGLPGEDERALACYEDVTARLIAAGYPPYRLNVAAMHHAETAPPYGAVLQRLKTALDPAGVLAPGRYQPVEAVPQLDVPR